MLAHRSTTYAPGDAQGDPSRSPQGADAVHYAQPSAGLATAVLVLLALIFFLGRRK